MADTLDFSDVPVIDEDDPKDAVPVEAVAGGSPYTSFSRKDLIKERNGKLFGNWNGSFAGACIDPFTNKYIEKDSVLKKESAGKCSGTNHKIMKYTHN